jgi:hypothetical protein
MEGKSAAEGKGSEMMMARVRGPAYMQAYQESYRDRLKGKRKSSALVGGPTGTAVLFALIVSAGG